MDVHIPYAITTQSRLRGIDVLTSQEDGTQELDDSKLLDRASALGKILVTQDDDLLREASARRNKADRSWELFVLALSALPSANLSLAWTC